VAGKCIELDQQIVFSEFDWFLKQKYGLTLITQSLANLKTELTATQILQFADKIILTIVTWEAIDDQKLKTVTKLIDKV